MKTGIDWAAKPEPWCWVGPALRADVEAIVAGIAPPWGSRVRIHDAAALELRDRRVKARLTQTELARRVGCSCSTISNIENGIGSASGSMWGRIDAELIRSENMDSR